VIIKRLVKREDIAVAWLVGDLEHVVLSEGEAETDTRDPGELGELLVEYRVLEKQHTADRLEFTERWQKFLSSLPRG
jgi:hypothetical protein